MRFEINPKYVDYAMAVGMMTLCSASYADDPIKRLLDLQLKKGIITQDEYTHDVVMPHENGCFLVYDTT